MAWIQSWTWFCPKNRHRVITADCRNKQESSWALMFFCYGEIKWKYWYCSHIILYFKRSLVFAWFETKFARCHYEAMFFLFFFSARKGLLAVSLKWNRLPVIGSTPENAIWLWIRYCRNIGETICLICMFRNSFFLQFLGAGQQRSPYCIASLLH